MSAVKMTLRAQARDPRGYFGIGIEHGKTTANIGTLWRSAYSLDAAFLFTIGRRYSPQASDTVKSWRHVPLFTYPTFGDFYANLPHDCMLVGVELDETARPIEAFTHPQRCVYLLGAEDHGLSAEAKARCHHLVQLRGRFCLNVAVAGSIVLYHRNVQRMAAESMAA